MVVLGKACILKNENEKWVWLNKYIFFLFALYPSGVYRFLTSDFLLIPFPLKHFQLLMYLFRVYPKKQLAKQIAILGGEIILIVLAYALSCLVARLYSEVLFLKFPHCSSRFKFMKDSFYILVQYSVCVGCRTH